MSLQEAIQLDGEILFSLLQKVSPVAHKHLSRQKIDPLLYMTEWFMCAFARTLPWSSVLRVWDMFFCEGTRLCWIVGRGLQEKPQSLPGLITCPHTGVKIIFRVGLVLLKHALGSPEKLRACQGQYETIEQLRSLSPKIMQEAFLVQEVWTIISHLAMGGKGSWQLTLEEALHGPAPRAGWSGQGRVVGPLILLLGEEGWAQEALCSVLAGPLHLGNREELQSTAPYFLFGYLFSEATN